MTKAEIDVGRARLSALRARMADAEAADSSLARRNRRFASHVGAIQRCSLKHIMEHPNSQAYKDYIEYPASR